MNDTTITVVGNVGSDIDCRDIGSGVYLSTFRLAATPRRFDRNQRQYVDDPTNWFSVQCWRSLAQHCRDSLRCGDPVIVIGRLKTQEWTKEGTRHTRFIVDATAIGHDLTRGRSTFTRVARTVEAVPDHAQAAMQAAQDVEDSTSDLPEVADPFADSQVSPMEPAPAH